MKKVQISFLFVILALGVTFQLEAAAASAAKSEPPSAKRARHETSGEEDVITTATSKPPVFSKPTFDTSFKQMFRADEKEGISREAQYDVLSSFISAFLRRSVIIVKTITEFVPPLREGSATQRAMDIVCEDNTGVRYNIEMQNDYQHYWDGRAFYYMTALYHQQIRSAAYDKLKPVRRIQAAKDEGVAEGRTELLLYKKDIALKGLKKSWSLASIIEFSNLSAEEIRSIAAENGIEIRK